MRALRILAPPFPVTADQRDVSPGSFRHESQLDVLRICFIFCGMPSNHDATRRLVLEHASPLKASSIFVFFVNQPALTRFEHDACNALRTNRERRLRPPAAQLMYEAMKCRFRIPRYRNALLNGRQGIAHRFLDGGLGSSAA